MLFSELKKKITETIAPPENALIDDVYGIQLGHTQKIRNFKKIVITLEPTKKVILKTIKIGAHIIISHHPLISKPTQYFREPLIEQLHLLTTHNITLFVLQSAWTSAEGGLTDSFAKTTGMQIRSTFIVYDKPNHPIPLGRILIPPPFYLTTQNKEGIPIGTVISNLKRNLNCDIIKITGTMEKKIRKAAIIAGKGAKKEYILAAFQQGCDTYITGEATHSEILLAKELGMTLIITSHYHSEKIGMMQLEKRLSLEFPRDEFYYIDSENPLTSL